jgi:hypothetical protein
MATATYRAVQVTKPGLLEVVAAPRGSRIQVVSQTLELHDSGVSQFP